MGDVGGQLPKIDAVLARLANSQQQALDRLFEWLRIPSVSADPACHRACELAAEWAALQLREIGFSATVYPTPGKPMVIGHWRHSSPLNPHVLFYGHYDVQPADPLEQWLSPPFEPRLIENSVSGHMIVARGADDDKGQVMTFFEACRALRDETGELPLSITVFLEGEEESGSPSLPAFLDEYAEELRADFVLVCDTGQWDGTTPAITSSLRGIAYVELTVSGPNRDLHSGMYGGLAMNPIRALTGVLARMHDSDGRVQIPGFYDGIINPTADQLKQWHGLNFDAKEFLAEVGLSHFAGEADHTPLEQIWSRPTAEINGIWGGYTGEGTKTVIPAEASAKLSFRLVPGQDPQSILERFEAFVEAHLPADCLATFKHTGGSVALTSDMEHPIMSRIAAALRAEWGVAPVFMGCGGSIPIVGAFKNKLGMDAALVGFGLSDDGAHSPNEKYDLVSFTKGARSWVRILEKLAE